MGKKRKKGSLFCFREKGAEDIELTNRQKEILEIVKEEGPISGEDIASRLSISRAALRPHIAILTTSGLLEARPRVGYFYVGKEGKHFWSDYFNRVKVKDIKFLPVVVKEQTSVYDAVVTLFLEEVGTLFVVDEEGYLKGSVSQKDLLKASIGSSDLTIMPVAVIMTRGVGQATLDPEESVLEAAAKLFEYDVDALPVVSEESKGDGKFKVTGRVSKTTLVRLLMDIGKE